MKKQQPINEKHRKLFNEALKTQWAEAGGDIDDPMLRERIWQRIHRTIHRTKTERLLRNYWRAAVSAAAAVIVALWVVEFSDRGIFTGSDTPAGSEWLADKYCKRMLPDSSVVWMAAGSSLRYAGDFSEERRVWLDGDATFEVKKHNGRPFRVCLDDSYVEVKGTVFSVKRSGADLVTVSLYEGRVDFVAEATGAVASLTPSQQVVFDRNTATVSCRELPPQIRWHDGSYLLQQVDLPRLVEFLEQHYDVAIRTDITSSASMKMTGEIAFDEPLSSVLSTICFTLNMNCICETDGYVLTNTNL